MRCNCDRDVPLIVIMPINMPNINSQCILILLFRKEKAMHTMYTRTMDILRYFHACTFCIELIQFNVAYHSTDKVHKLVQTYMHTSILTFIYIYSYVHTYIYIYMYRCTYIHVICLHVYIYIYICQHVCLCVCPSVRPSVPPSVRPSIRLSESVRPRAGVSVCLYVNT